MHRSVLAGLAAATLTMASPASADWRAPDEGVQASADGHAGDSGGVPVPHLADFALFALGVLGIFVGRYGSRVRDRSGRP